MFAVVCSMFQHTVLIVRKQCNDFLLKLYYLWLEQQTFVEIEVDRNLVIIMSKVKNNFHVATEVVSPTETVQVNMETMEWFFLSQGRMFSVILAFPLDRDTIIIVDR